VRKFLGGFMLGALLGGLLGLLFAPMKGKDFRALAERRVRQAWEDAQKAAEAKRSEILGKLEE
jgi:gas vesicle protein